MKQLDRAEVHSLLQDFIYAALAKKYGHTVQAEVSISTSCTRCDNDRFYSHRAGDLGRQIGVIFAPPLA